MLPMKLSGGWKNSALLDDCLTRATSVWVWFYGSEIDGGGWEGFANVLEYSGE